MALQIDWHQVPLFDVVPDHYRGVLDAGVEIREFEPDDIVLELRADGRIDRMLVVLDGVVELRGNRDHWVVGLLHRGDFAFNSRLSIGRFPVECLAAVTPVRAAILSWDTVQVLSKTVPPWRKQLKHEALRIDARLKEFQLI